MALYREGKAAMAADGTVTGTGTKWQSSLSLIRPGATIMFLSSPIQMAVVNKVVSDTEIKAITTNGAVVASSDYAILLSDSLTVDGLAQDVAETLRYYQSQETVIADAVEFFKNFDFDSLQDLANKINADSESAQSSAAAAAASENAAKTSENNAKSSEVAAENARDQVQQIINDAGDASTLVVLAQADGGDKIGFKLNSTYAPMRTVRKRLLDTINVIDFGAKGDGVTDDYPAFQYAAMYAESIGGAIIEIPTPAVEYKIGFPIYLFSNTHFKGTGINCRINFTDPIYARKSRSGFVIGSGREQNRDKAIQCLMNGTWATTGSVVDSTFVELSRGVYLRDNLSKVQSSNCCVSDVYLVATYPNGTTLKGGYGVSFANAIDCEAYNLWGEGWTEIINIGSDVPPATPSCHNCHAYNIICVEPNHYETYYSAGFIANSTACSIHDYKQLKPIADGSPHGSGASMNYTEDCLIYNFDIPSLGRTASSEGVLVNNSKGAVVHDINGGNAKSLVSEYYTTEVRIFYDAAKPNVFYNIHANNCDHAVALRSKYSVWKNVTQSNCTDHVYFGTSNAQYCDVRFVPDSIGCGSGLTPWHMLQSNYVAGWRVRTKYIRPINYLLNDKSSLQSWDTNRNMKAKAGTNLQVLYDIPVTMRAIAEVRCYLTFEVGALTAGSNVKMSIRRMVNYSGNSSEAPYIEATNTKTATSDKVQDTTLVMAAGNTDGFIKCADTTHGLENSLDLLVEINNPTVNMNLKEIKFTYLGD